jgi:predicted DNA-binding ribbon-helix-helix protein
MTELKPSNFVRRCFRLQDRRTSISLEPLFWEYIDEAARREGLTCNAIVLALNFADQHELTSALRVWVLSYWQTAAAAPKS